MRILLSAFAFAPNTGSEPGVGWRWAIELARKHEVTVVTDVTRRCAVEASGQTLPDNLSICYFRPSWLRAIPLNSSTAQLLYTAWQFGLLGFARKLLREQHFDLAMHITYGVFRHPSFLGLLGIPFVFGPLGGGEDAPMCLKCSIHGKEKFKEIARTLLNRMALFDPFLWIAFARSTVILTKTAETRSVLPWPFRQRAIVYSEIAIDPVSGAVVCQRVAGEPLRILFVGRLLGWKGAHFALRALMEARNSGVNAELTIVGNGPYESELKRVASDLGAGDVIHWLSHIPQIELFRLYGTMHCFLFPSLHDSSGNVVLEAQAHGLPVICLDIGGPFTLVTQESAIVVTTKNTDENGVVARLSDAIQLLAKDEARRIAMGTAAMAHTRTMSWSSQVAGVLDLVFVEARR
jgi:glycosyltransferase involved in cell wall biosynthesis